jgi:hypothetical protein
MDKVTLTIYEPYAQLKPDPGLESYTESGWSLTGIIPEAVEIAAAVQFAFDSHRGFSPVSGSSE